MSNELPIFTGFLLLCATLILNYFFGDSSINYDFSELFLCPSGSIFLFWYLKLEIFIGGILEIYWESELSLCNASLFSCIFV